jgi:hypothetical protein
MGFYQDQIVPLLINLAMRRQDLAAYRSRIVPAAEGRVLEIGSGLNLPFYSRHVQQVIGVDPSPKPSSPWRVELIDQSLGQWTSSGRADSAGEGNDRYHRYDVGSMQHT